MPKPIRSFKLYWVETPSPEENCFVAATSSRSAARYEDCSTGFDPGDCIAELVCTLDQAWVDKYRGKKSSDSDGGPFYVQFEDVHELGIKWSVVEGDDIFF